MAPSLWHRTAALFLILLPLATFAQTLTLPQTSYKRCTEQKESGSCYELGNLYQNTSKPGDIALGNQYIRFGCKLELKRTCTQKEADARSVQFLRAKSNWDAQKQKALNEMPSIKTEDELKCEKGDGKACDSAGTHYFFLSQPRNPEKGKALFEEGCRLHDSSSCSTLELIKKGIVKVFEVEM